MPSGLAISCRHASCMLGMVAVLAAAPSSVHAGQEQNDGTGPWIETNLTQAEAREAYGSEAGAIDLEQACRLLLELTNEERRAARLHEVQAHQLAAWLAQDQADGMAREHCAGHCDPSGRKCELRFNLLGQAGHVSENTAYYEIQHKIYLTPQLIRRLHMHWMESDAHRANILHPAHTHLGIGFAVLREEGMSYVAAVEEFVNDYGDYDRLPRHAGPGATVHLSGYVDPEAVTLKYIGLGREELPVPLRQEGSRDKMCRQDGYSQPGVETAYLPKQYMGLYRPEIRIVHYRVDYDEATGGFAVDIALPAYPEAGAYYITVWADGLDPVQKPFRAMTQVVLVGGKDETTTPEIDVT